MRSRRAPFLLCLLFFLLTGPWPATATGSQNDGRVPVVVSIPPQLFFVERIGGERVRADVMVRPGQSPHTYAPTPKQMAGLARAKIYFRIGVAFENGFLPKLQSAVPDIRIVDTTSGITLAKMTAHDEHGDDHGHQAEELDIHTWLDPMLVKQQAAIIRDSLSELDPADRSLFAANYRRFAEELDALHLRLSQSLAPYRGKSFFVFHPAFGYFARAYGLHQVAVESGGKQPGPRHLARLIDRARAEGVQVLFVQPQFSVKSAETIARAIDGVVIPLDPLAPDYLANMGRIAVALEKALR
ncbi:MAG: metal ABC transporter solute-binding protein, Zn/Mn family [Thermodesulfobacteriota bacterium]